MKNKTAKLHKDANRTCYAYECIDGNMTYHPTAYCTRYEGVLTRGLERTHKCRERECRRYKQELFE